MNPISVSKRYASFDAEILLVFRFKTQNPAKFPPGQRLPIKLDSLSFESFRLSTEN